ncbi:MAG: carboxylating nicotinate-nucleotide diphosphorylase, partial [Planctomycetota bacterium]
QRLSGTATATRRCVDLVAGTGARIYDTRKTTPGMRLLQKHAVRCGGGHNHRIGLYDMVLIKENHVALMEGAVSGPAEAVRRARATVGPDVRIQVEIERLADLEPVIAAGTDLILLDNMDCEQLREAVRIRGGHAVKLEASGGITDATLRAVAETGVDRISIGALTHSVASLDLSLRCSPL